MGASGTEVTSSPANGRFRKLLREPLVHFLLIGAAIFIAYLIVAPPQVRSSGYTIELTNDDLRQIDLAFAAKWRREPTPAEWHSLIEEQVREEILYREGLKLGLDQGDEIIRRRLGQKLDFLMDDVSSLHDPTDAELRAWYARNGAQFADPSRVTFCHVYFSPDDGPSPEKRAAAALEKLKARPSCKATGSIGDRFPDYDYYADRTTEEVVSVFGTEFSNALFKLKPGPWQGPIESGLGWHLVLIENLAPGHIPPFNAVNRAQIIAAWQDSQRDESKRKVYQAMRAKYEVVLPKGSGS
jgi:hypothetical protein